MSVKRTGSAILIAAVTLSSAASAATVGAKQRVAITITPSVGAFVLTPLTRGETKRDSGNVSWQRESERVLMRDGQRVELWIGTGTFIGKRGEFLIRFRIDWLDAGNGREAGSGTWKIIRGTGDYANLAGAGRSAHVWLPRGPAASRAEGFMRSG